MRPNTRVVIVMVGATTVLALMAFNFGPAYAGFGVLAIIARWLIRPTDLLRWLPFRTDEDATVVKAHFGGIVEILAAKAGVARPRLIAGRGKRPTAMIVGSPSDSAIVFRGAVHGLSRDEKEALVAHEIGHLRRNHFVVKWATTATLALALLSLARWTVMHGEENPPDPVFVTSEVGAALLAVAVVAFIAHEWIGYIIEAEADHEAVELIGHPRGIVAMLERELPKRQGPLSMFSAWPIQGRIRRLSRGQ